MKKLKIAPATYKIAVRIVAWNHAIWNRNGYEAEPDAIAKAIIRDAAKIRLEIAFNMCRGLEPYEYAPADKWRELTNAIDAITRNKGKHAMPQTDRIRLREWKRDMDWYNNRRYNGYVQETWAQACAYYLQKLRDDTRKDVKKLCELADGLTYAKAERKRELAARMNDPKNVTQSLIYDAKNELPF